MDSKKNGSLRLSDDNRLRPFLSNHFSHQDFINKVIHIQLIKRKPVNRLGLNGPEEVKNHPWLSDVKWEKIREKNFASPYKPNALQDNFDNRVLLTDDPLLEADAKAKDIKQDDKTTNDLFAEYFYNIHDENSSTNKHK